jgi:hypothetical protein
MRDRLVRRQFHHLLELDDRLVVLGVFFVGDAKIEPGVRNRRILLLNPLEFGDRVGGFCGAQ